MFAEDETIRCLLCRGVVSFTQEEDQRYKDHLKVEHRVYFYLSWIVQKTLDENSNGNIQKLTEDVHEPISITKVTKPSTNGPGVEVTGLEDQDEGDEDQDLAWEALNNVQAQIEGGSDSDEVVAITYDNKEVENPFAEGVTQNGFYKSSPSKFKLAGILPKLNQNGHTVESVDPSEISFNEDYGDSNGFGDDSMDHLERTENEGQKAFLLVYPTKDGKGSNYRCSICTSLRVFDSKSRAEQHLKTHIPLHERKRFQCPQCKERFITAKNLEKHIRMALCQGIKLYFCNVCKQQFDNKYDLGEHKKTTHAQFRIRHNCDVCGEGFRTREALKRHIRRHTGEKPFTCEICSKSFKTSSYVKTHKRTQHNIIENGESNTSINTQKNDLDENGVNSEITIDNGENGDSLVIDELRQNGEPNGEMENEEPMQNEEIHDGELRQNGETDYNCHTGQTDENEDLDENEDMDENGYSEENGDIANDDMNSIPKEMTIPDGQDDIKAFEKRFSDNPILCRF